MKFTVEVDEFWIEEGDLTKGLKDAIHSQIISQIRKDIHDQVQVFMNDYIKSTIREEIQGRVQTHMDEFVKTGRIDDRYNSEKNMTIAQYIALTFTNARPEITKTVDAKVTAAIKVLKDQYDLHFATQIITKIKEQGFLKEEAAKMLLQNEAPVS